MQSNRDRKLAPGVYTRMFTGQAADDWREAFPDLPPGPEIVLHIKLSACVNCGADPAQDKIGGFDPIELRDDGLLIGEHVCLDCMEKGH